MDRTPVARLCQVSHRYGCVAALDGVDVDLPAGGMVGLIGPDGVGKSSLLALISGARQIQAGRVEVLGGDIGDALFRASVLPRIAYMPQGLGKKLYPTLSVYENVDFFGRLFGQGKAERAARIADLLAATGLSPFADRPAARLSGGMKQKLGLCCALIHDPDLLILDEPTSGVDPVARDEFEELLVELLRQQGVTIFISTHFMNEAERCDRISLMHAGKVLASDTPAALCAARGEKTLEAAFIGYLEEASGVREAAAAVHAAEAPITEASPGDERRGHASVFSLRRLFGYAYREALELRRDMIRLGFALLGSVIMMFVLGYGLFLDVENLRFAVLDHDQSPESRDYVAHVAGSRYFIQRPDLLDEADLDRRMKSGEVSLAIEIPADYGCDLRRGRHRRSACWSTAPCLIAAKRCAATSMACTANTFSACCAKRRGRRRRSPSASPRATATTRISRASMPWCRRSFRCSCCSSRPS